MPAPIPLLRVVLVPGHGYSNSVNGVYDSGAVGPDGMTEAAVCAEVAVHILADLEEPPMSALTPACSLGCIVKHPQLADGTHANHLSYLVHYINQNYASPFDVVLSLHMNAADNEQASGVEVYYSKDAPEGRAAEALAMCEAISDVLCIPCRGAHPSNASQHSSLAILDKTKAKAFLIEMGFITNCEDTRIVRELGAKAVIAGYRTLPGAQPKKEN